MCNIIYGFQDVQHCYSFQLVHYSMVLKVYIGISSLTFLLLLLWFPTCSVLFISWSGSVVGVATRYGLDGPGIESRWGRDFPHLSRSALGSIQPSVQWVPGLSRG